MKILLVDDELHVIRAIRQLVPWEDLGISQVLEADSGRAALTVLQQESPEIVITDVVMQDLTGLELMQILQQRLAALSISSVSQHVLMSQSLRHQPLSLTL